LFNEGLDGIRVGWVGLKFLGKQLMWRERRKRKLGHHGSSLRSGG